MESTLGSRLAWARKEKKLTMQQVADRLGIARPTYSGYESNYREPDVDTLAKLAELYNVTTDYLSGRTDDPNGTVSVGPVDDTIPPEERKFLEWVKTKVSGTFFYDWDKSQSQDDYIKGLRIIYELEKDRKPGQKQGE